MINVNTVKEQAELLAKKNQSGGYFTPADFNRVVPMVVRDIVRKYYGIPEQYQPGMPMPAITYEETQLVKDYLSALKPRKPIVKADGYFPLPPDYLHKSSLRHKHSTIVPTDKDQLYAEADECSCGETDCSCKIDSAAGKPTLQTAPPPKAVTVDKWFPIKVLTDEDFDWEASSITRKPTFEYPIARFEAAKIEVLPVEITTIELSYLRYPATPVWGYTTAGGFNVYNPLTSTNIELPEICSTEVVMRLLSYMGISIREAAITQWAENKKNTGN